jgi:L-rhamnose mutarotase
MKRYGSIIEVKEEKLDEYIRLHTEVWSEVLDMIKKCNIHNYSIYLRKLPDGKHYLFSYFEYTGTNYEADMAKMTSDPNTQRWWDICKPCQNPFPDLAESDWWASMEEVFHVD